jgi:hypothetical protein
MIIYDSAAGYQARDDSAAFAHRGPGRGQCYSEWQCSLNGAGVTITQCE